MKVRCIASALTIRSLPIAAGATDTGKRMIKNQVAQAYARSFDGKWLYVDAAAGRGWVSEAYTQEANDARVVIPAWPAVPNGLAAIIKTFGEAGNINCHTGSVALREPLPLGWDKTSRASSFSCHRLVAPVFQSAFDAIHERGLWLLLKTFDGAYTYRPSKLHPGEQGSHEELPLLFGASKLSTHAWGITVDLNASENELGSPPRMDSRIVAIFRDHGFKWGGDWARPDGMHFQYATGY